MRMDLGMRSTSHYDSMPCMTVASLEMSDEPEMRMDLGMRSTSHYDSMPCMTVASLEMSDEPKSCHRSGQCALRMRLYTVFVPSKKSFIPSQDT